MPNWNDAKVTVSKVRVLTRDKHNRITSASVPGTSGTYQTRLVRQDHTVYCRCDRNDGKECLGNRETVCYHCLATILAGIDEAQVEVEWFNDKRAAWSNRGNGRVVEVRSSQSDRSVWAVVRHLG
jgi:hypothetical protein